MGKLIVGFILFAISISIGLYIYLTGRSTSQKSQQKALESTINLSALQGRWLTSVGHGYDAVLVGNTLEFRFHEAYDSVHSGFQAGEMHFALQITTDNPDAVTLYQKLRPVLSGQLKYTKESLGACQLVINDINGKPLRAKISNNQLTIDYAEIISPLPFLEIKRGKLVNCKNLQTSKMEITQQIINKLEDGKDFPITTPQISPKQHRRAIKPRTVSSNPSELGEN